MLPLIAHLYPIFISFMYGTAEVLKYVVMYVNITLYFFIYIYVCIPSYLMRYLRMAYVFNMAYMNDKHLNIYIYVCIYIFTDTHDHINIYIYIHM